MKRVFISRYLEEDSFLRQQLSKTNFHLHDESLISFSLVEVPEIPSSNWLFFYSKNGVKFSLAQAIIKEVLPHRHLATMGKGTAKVLEDAGFAPEFIGNGHPAMTGIAFHEFIETASVLFIQAQQSRHSLQSFFPDAPSLVVYDNFPKQQFSIPTPDILVFTSPMNAEAYYQIYNPLSHQIVIAIGATTASALENLGIATIHTANSPSERGVWEVIEQLYN